MGIYLVLANLSEFIGITPPTKDLNVTAGMAFMAGRRCYLRFQFPHQGAERRPAQICRAFAHRGAPDILEIGIRPLSLCMRLFGNVFASFVIMEWSRSLPRFWCPFP